MIDLTVTEQIFIGWIIAHAFVTGWALTLLYYVKRRCDLIMIAIGEWNIEVMLDDNS